MCDNSIVALMRKEDKKFIEVTGGMPKELKNMLYVPQFGEKYYLPHLGDVRFLWNTWEGTDEDLECLQLGLVCKTSILAESLADVLLSVVKHNKKYRLKEGEIYYRPILEKRMVEIEAWRNDDFDDEYKCYKLVCRTKAQAERWAKELFAALWKYRSYWGNRYED